MLPVNSRKAIAKFEFGWSIRFICLMLFDWDDEKNQRNIRKHGLSFEESMEIFRRPRLTRIDDRDDYGEIREINVGIVGEQIIIVMVHTERLNTIRIISARKANHRERSLYYEYLKNKA